jgi:hypothetical protein
LKLFDLKTPQIEIITLADIPAGTGPALGQFYNCPAQALYAYRKRLRTA